MSNSLDDTYLRKSIEVAIAQELRKGHYTFDVCFNSNGAAIVTAALHGQLELIANRRSKIRSRNVVRVSFREP